MGRAFDKVEKTNPGLLRFALSSWGTFKTAMYPLMWFTSKEESFVAGYCAGVIEGERLRRCGAYKVPEDQL